MHVSWRGFSECASSIRYARMPQVGKGIGLGKKEGRRGWGGRVSDTGGGRLLLLQLVSQVGES